jgi:hypothetical protein
MKRGIVATHRPRAIRLARHDPSRSPPRALDVDSKENNEAAIPVGKNRNMQTNASQK